ncbi:hypothetical protein GCM10020255_070580 [Rhodococcus baikonurensis]
MDFSAMEEFAKDLDPSALTDPSKLEALMQQGTFEPQNTPEQKAALERLETLLALVEGWVETVVTAALGERLPGVGAMSETLRRRRATGGPAEQTLRHWSDSNFVLARSAKRPDCGRSSPRKPVWILATASGHIPT